MKPFGNLASIIFNDNKAISSSKCNWEHLRKNSSIRFGNDSNFYTILDSESFLYVTNFNISEGNILISSESSLFTGDSVDISYKEYTILTILDIKSAGIGYKVDDIIYPNTGFPSINKKDNSQRLTQFLVTEVDYMGAIQKVVIKYEGRYIEPPSEFNILTGGSGREAEFRLQYRFLPERVIIEREIVSNLNGVLKINYPLPIGIKEGKISCKKWKANLSEAYTGETQIGIPYYIIRDVTPNYGFPLLLKGNPNPETICNEALRKVDAKLYELESLIKSLKS